MLVCDDGEWVAVCDRAGYFPTNNSLDAQVVCYEFNLAGEGAQGNHCKPAIHKGSFDWQNITCVGTEEKLIDCQRMPGSPCNIWSFTCVKCPGKMVYSTMGLHEKLLLCYIHTVHLCVLCVHLLVLDPSLHKTPIFL